MRYVPSRPEPVVVFRLRRAGRRTDHEGKSDAQETHGLDADAPLFHDREIVDSWMSDTTTAERSEELKAVP